MQASASSQTISPANIPSPQAKPDVNKADAASPFALLIASTARDPVKTAKKDVKDSSDRPAEPPAKQNDVKQNDDKQDGRQDGRDVAQTAAQSKPAAPAKSEKTGKDKDVAGTGKDSAEDEQVVAAGQQIADQQASTTVVQAPIPVPAETDTRTDAEADIAIESAAPAAGATTPLASTDVPQSEPADTAVTPETDLTAQPQAQVAAQDDRQIGGADTAEIAAAATPPVDTKLVAAKDTDKPAPVKTAAKSETTDTIQSDTAKVESTGDEPAQAGTAPTGDEPVHAQAKHAKTDIAKDDLANAPKGHAAPDTAANNVKADTSTADSQKTDTSQANVHPVETDSAPDAVKPVPPQSASVSNAIFAINTIAAPQAAQHAQAPTATQHVQVTAQPAPNLPALAVEISAKSQSGAKQFDIRLDPPELGRVEVRLSIDATGKASAHLSADQPQTLSLLQKDAPILTRALREAGLDVAQDGLNFSLRQQAQGQNGNQDGSNGRFGSARAFSLAATASIDPAAASFAYRSPSDGRVDIRV